MPCPMKVIRLRKNRDRIFFDRWYVKRETYAKYFYFTLLCLAFCSYSLINGAIHKEEIKPKFQHMKKVIKQQSLIPQAYADVVPTATPEPQDTYDIVKTVFINRFGADQWSNADAVIQMESSWNPWAVNASSGSCGLGQSLPCSKVLSYAGSLDNIQGQAEWMADYIANRYGTPYSAYIHELNYHWY